MDKLPIIDSLYINGTHIFTKSAQGNRCNTRKKAQIIIYMIKTSNSKVNEASFGLMLHQKVKKLSKCERVNAKLRYTPDCMLSAKRPQDVTHPHVASPKASCCKKDGKIKTEFIFLNERCYTEV